MTDDRTADALHRLSVRPDISRPLSSDAQARIEARLDAAFSDAVADDDRDANTNVDGIELVAVRSESERALGRRRWLVPVTAAAAAIVLVVGLVVVSGDDSQPATDLVGSPTTVFPADLLRPGTGWRLMTDPIESGGGAASASLTIRMEDVARAQARVETADVPPRQFLGEVRFEVDPTGHVLIPLLLLDPERAWVDCDATIDLSGSGTAMCAGEVVDYAAAAGPADIVVTPAGRYEASRIDVDWTTDNSLDGNRTRIWISPLAGPVRIEVDDRESPRTFTLQELNAPDASPITTPSGD
jgi:hypothetical protein